MIKNISVESTLSIAESDGKSIAELMDILMIPARLAEITENSSPDGREWNPKTLVEIDRSTPKPKVK